VLLRRMIKKVTIITPPEYDILVLERLGRSGITQLKEVSGPEIERLRGVAPVEHDYKTLYERVHSRYDEFIKMVGISPKPYALSTDELREFAASPGAVVEKAVKELERLIAQFKELKDSQAEEVKYLAGELQRAINEENARYEAEKEREKARYEEVLPSSQPSLSAASQELSRRLGLIEALKPEEFKSSFAAGIAKNEDIEKLQEYIGRYPDVYYRTESISPEESIIFIFGPEEVRNWVEALFLVFNVKEVFDVISPGDVLLVLDPERRREVIEKYREALRQLEETRLRAEEPTERPKTDLERLLNIEFEHKQRMEALMRQHEERMRELEEKHAREVEALKEEQVHALSRIAAIDRFLRILSEFKVPMLRTRIITILQGWVPEKRVPEFEKIIGDVEAEIGEKLFVQFSDPDPEEDLNVPTPPPEIKPSFLQPAWTLTTLRGWPSPHEVNPAYITILIFSLQFGLMFGDIGQGAVFLIMGLYLTRKYKRGMISKLGTLFIPMGISAMIFGFLYGSVFLMEHLEIGPIKIEPILLSPIHQIGKLMKMVLGIAVAEMCLGLAIGAINHIKEGEPLGAIGERGLGGILFTVGLYLGGLEFLRVGDIMSLMSHWTFFMMIGGLILSAIEPMLLSVTHKHFGMEAVGEGIGALLMTFVENLANFFSFLRIAAFALAHASLAIAAEALAHFMGPGGLVMTNGIAMTFEFVSSTVQSLRLLYYEFMGKFFQGKGVPFKPLEIPSGEEIQTIQPQNPEKDI
jgi:vacuolar-type H+-ATPase subunit I/STV1